MFYLIIRQQSENTNYYLHIYTTLKNVLVKISISRYRDEVCMEFESEKYRPRDMLTIIGLTLKCVSKRHIYWSKDETGVECVSEKNNELYLCRWWRVREGYVQLAIVRSLREILLWIIFKYIEWRKRENIAIADIIYSGMEFEFKMYLCTWHSSRLSENIFSL